MFFDLREAAICAVTMLSIMLAGVLAVGGAAAVFAVNRPATVQVQLDRCVWSSDEQLIANGRPQAIPAPPSESGLQCPIERKPQVDLG
jgi:hypothetical protein